MKADGELIVLNREDNELEFRAASVSLGSMGVIVSVKVWRLSLDIVTYAIFFIYFRYLLLYKNKFVI